MAKVIALGNLQEFLSNLDNRFIAQDTPSTPTTLVGTKSATSGYTLEIPWIEVNENGIIVSAGTHTHTIPQLFDKDSSGNITLHTEQQQSQNNESAQNE